MTPLARYAITAGVSGLVGFAAASYLRPRVLHESHTEYVDRWHEVVTTRTVVDVKTRTVVQRVIEEKRPDGTEITTHETEGTSTEITDRSEQKAEAEGSKAVDTRTVARQASTPRFGLMGMGGLGLRGERAFGAAFTYRLLGPITVGAWGLSLQREDVYRFGDQEIKDKRRDWIFGGSLGVTW